MTMYTKFKKRLGMVEMLQTFLVWTLLLGLFTTITACGFHPRGSSALPPAMSVVYIKSAQPYSSLVDDFTDALEAQGGRVTRLQSEASAILHIVSNEIVKRVLSITTAGKVLEFETQQTIRFSVVTRENLTIVKEQEVSLTSDYLFTSDEILPAEREDKVARDELQRNLVYLAMLRITAAAR